MGQDNKEYNQRLSRIVGGNIRRLRIQAGLNQSEMGAYLGVSFQQFQKYERGIDRVSGIALYRLAQALSCSPMEFYAGLAEFIAGRGKP